MNRATNRVLTTSDWCHAMLRRQRPALCFDGQTQADYRRWRCAFEKRFRDMLGRFPPQVPLRPRLLERRVFARYVREHVVFDAEPCMSVPAWVCVPRTRRPGERLPAVLCAHGHGAGGCSMVGLGPDLKPAYGYVKNIAVRLAEAGFVTIAPDWRGFGERREPPETDPAPNDLCNLAHLVAEHFGFNQLALNIWDGMRALDYLATRPEVDMRRVGGVGCSFGGTMTTFLAAADRRIRAACISGYLSPTGGGLAALGTCGSQTLPGLLRWGDRADVAGLICPRPLLIQIGRYDATFPSTGALREYARLRRIYTAAGRSDRLELDLFEGCHEINVPPLIDWFQRRLQCGGPA